MASQWRHVSVGIERSRDDVYDFVRDPANLNAWAQGLGNSVHEVDGRWFAQTSGGRVGIAFADRNGHGVLDHDITLPDGRALHVPMRVFPDGDGCEVVFHVQRLPGVADDDFERDATAVATDLATLKRVLETGQD